MTEILDLVDENDNVVKTLPRDEIYAQNLQEQYYVRSVDVFIRNAFGRLWIPVRNDDKRIAPGGFDIGVGGHVEHGETYDEAFRKEILEEVGWNIDDVEWRQIGKFGPKEGLYSMSMAYEITTDQAPELNTDDFKSAQWMDPQEVYDKIAAGHPAKSNLKPLLGHAYDIS